MGWLTQQASSQSGVTFRAVLVFLAFSQICAMQRADFAKLKSVLYTGLP